MTAPLKFRKGWVISSTLNWTFNYLSMQGFNLTHVSKRGHRSFHLKNRWNLEKCHGAWSVTSVLFPFYHSAFRLEGGCTASGGLVRGWSRLCGTHISETTARIFSALSPKQSYIPVVVQRHGHLAIWSTSPGPWTKICWPIDGSKRHAWRWNYCSSSIQIR